MLATRKLVGLCVVFLAIFAGFLISSSISSVHGVPSPSLSAEQSSGGQLLAADGTEPQPSPMPVPSPWHKLAA
jgi:hypothetical protein